MLSWFAPVLAQTIMLVMMALNRRWLFAAMLAPGILTCMVSAMANLSRARRRGSAARDEAGDGRHGMGAAGDPDAAMPAGGRATRAQGAQRGSGFPAIESRPLESLLLGGRDGTPTTPVGHGTGTRTAPATLSWRHVLRQWTCADLSSGPVVALGADGPVRLDLSASGPHALVAGTTGSGKSLFLEAWCASYAFLMPPTRLNFVLLDFKGGATFRAIGRLPHAAGCVSDLDLRHATRALKAIEAELKRRERLVADHHATRLDQLPDPPPRLIVMVDEFHALKDQLPGYVDRLVALASLGRSLGMNLVLCTQNPMGQLSPQLKANVNLNVCLRVRDALQSKEMLGTDAAGDIPAGMPGAAWIHDGDGVVAMRCAPLSDAPAFTDACALAGRFLGLARRDPLFSPPLPRVVARGSPAMIALRDDGVTTHPLTLDPRRGPVAIVGPSGRGKTALLDAMHRALVALRVPVLRCRPDELGGPPLPPSSIDATPGPVIAGPGPSDGRTGMDPGLSDKISGIGESCGTNASSDAGAMPRFALLVDDADALLDPMGGHPGRQTFLDALSRPGPFVAFCVSSARHLRHPEHCSVRFLFPCGDKTADTFAGIPTWMHGEFSPDDCQTPGRAALLDGAHAWIVQCVAPASA